MEIRHLIPARGARISEDGWSCELLAFHALHVPDLPWTYPRFVVALHFDCEVADAGETFTVDVELRDPDMQPVRRKEGELRALDRIDPDRPDEGWKVLEFTDVLLETTGTYALVARVDGEERAQTTIRVVK